MRVKADLLPWCSGLHSGSPQSGIRDGCSSLSAETQRTDPSTSQNLASCRCLHNPEAPLGTPPGGTGSTGLAEGSAAYLLRTISIGTPGFTMAIFMDSLPTSTDITARGSAAGGGGGKRR